MFYQFKKGFYETFQSVLRFLIVFLLRLIRTWRISDIFRNRNHWVNILDKPSERLATELLSDFDSFADVAVVSGFGVANKTVVVTLVFIEPNLCEQSFLIIIC